MKEGGIDWGKPVSSDVQEVSIERIAKEDSGEVNRKRQLLLGLQEELIRLGAEYNDSASKHTFSFFNRKQRRSSEIIKMEIAQIENQIDGIEQDLEAREDRIKDISKTLDSTRRQIFSGKKDAGLPLQ